MFWGGLGGAKHIRAAVYNIYRLAGASRDYHASGECQDDRENTRKRGTLNKTLFTYTGTKN
jgi:hypothetical protein